MGQEAFLDQRGGAVVRTISSTRGGFKVNSISHQADAGRSTACPAESLETFSVVLLRQVVPRSSGDSRRMSALAGGLDDRALGVRQRRASAGNTTADKAGATALDGDLKRPRAANTGNDFVWECRRHVNLREAGCEALGLTWWRSRQVHEARLWRRCPQYRGDEAVAGDWPICAGVMAVRQKRVGAAARAVWLALAPDALAKSRAPTRRRPRTERRPPT